MLDTGETYKCAYCGTSIDWNGIDPVRGTLWYCEESGCGNIFCTSCFDERLGRGKAERMTSMDSGDDVIRCPDCYAKYQGVQIYERSKDNENEDN